MLVCEENINLLKPTNYAMHR